MTRPTTTGSPTPERASLRREHGAGLRRVHWELLVAGAAVLAGLMVATARMQQGNRALQDELAQQQLYLQQTVPLEQVHRDMARWLAGMAERGQDPDGRVRELLAAHPAPAR